MTTNTGTAVAEQKQQNPMVLVRQDLDRMGPEFAAALPQHIPLDRFKRVALTAINKNPDLLKADKRALMGAFTMAAQDGLLPDGREGAIVMFGQTPQWMPMVYGIIKKMRNSGELASISAHAVFAKDHFKYVLGDDERIEHEPTLNEDRGSMIAVYATAKLKDGTVQREVMMRADVEKVRNASRAKNGGPWKDWYEEMARKTVVRRLAKYLPMSTEVEQVLRRDDVLYATSSSTALPASPERPTTAAGQLQAFAAPPMLEHDAVAEDDEPDPAHVKHPLLSLDGEVLSETVSSTQWLERFEHALKKSTNPARLWEINADTAEWAADQTEDGDRIIFRLRDTYLPKEDAQQGERQATDAAPEQAEQQQDGGAPTAEPSEWDAEFEELSRIGRLPVNFKQWSAFAADHEQRIGDLCDAEGGRFRQPWTAFVNERVASFQAKGGAK
jgi:recombination protein RecT